MRVLIDNGTYELKNMGDVAMLQVAVERFQSRFPHARLQVLTKDPERLNFFCSGCEALDARGHDALLGTRLWPLPLSARMQRLTSLPERRLRRPFLGRMQRRAVRHDTLRTEQPRGASEAVGAFWEALCGADVVIGSGGGYLTEAFEGHALNVFDLLAVAAARGKVTALLGQGVGPLQGRLLRGAARETFPLLDLVTLRERMSSETLCLELGVREDRLLVTGDDAIEMAARATPSAPGEALGVNVRISYYSGVQSEQLARLRQSLGELARDLGAPLLGVPISTYAVESDSDSISRLLEGEAALVDNGQDVASPQAAIAQIARCRVVVTGSYHAGVFALSQGIPVIGLAASPYYVSKFDGLSAQFEGGCHVVTLGAPDWEEQLKSRTREMWRVAPTLSANLKAAAKRQIEAGHAAYEQLFQIIEARVEAKTARSGQGKIAP